MDYNKNNCAFCKKLFTITEEDISICPVCKRRGFDNTLAGTMIRLKDAWKKLIKTIKEVF